MSTDALETRKATPPPQAACKRSCSTQKPQPQNFTPQLEGPQRARVRPPSRPEGSGRTLPPLEPRQEPGSHPLTLVIHPEGLVGGVSRVGQHGGAPWGWSFLLSEGAPSPFAQGLHSAVQEKIHGRNGFFSGPSTQAPAGLPAEGQPLPSLTPATRLGGL